MTKREAAIAREIKKPGLRGKVNAMCISCIHDPESPGTWREQVTNCESYNCPLFGVRPLLKQGSKDTGKAVFGDELDEFGFET